METLITANNLRPLLVGIGWLCDDTFGQTDWIAVLRALPNTDAQADRWFESVFAGPRRVAYSVAREEVGSRSVRVRIALPDELAQQGWLLARFCKEFVWQGYHD